MADTGTIILRLLLALLLGGIIGAEREYRNKSAGFRTMIMISLGSCLFTLFSIYIGSPLNADRIASNIVTGIGFLGAGIIYKADDRVKGLTTAATVWFTAALGIGAGSGHYAAAIAGCVLGIFILALFTMMESRLDRLHEIRSYHIVCDFGPDRMEALLETFRRHRLKCSCTR
ncbi:MAG: MgtC/SapB family protein, partial [Bacteroidetes bacterium]|nr:MgtC/SapB family protein [Bacteroidota bacterium]